MSIQELGSIGEFVSAFAVFATLIYLAIQTRLTRKAAEETARFSLAETTRAIPQMYQKYREFLATRELAEIVVKARRGENLDDAERVMFSAIFEELFYNAACSYQSSFTGTSLHDSTADVDHMVAVLSANPLALEDWERSHPVIVMSSAEFVERVDEKLSTA